MKKLVDQYREQLKKLHGEKAELEEKVKGQNEEIIRMREELMEMSEQVKARTRVVNIIFGGDKIENVVVDISADIQELKDGIKELLIREGHSSLNGTRIRLLNNSRELKLMNEITEKMELQVEVVE